MSPAPMSFTLGTMPGAQETRYLGGGCGDYAIEEGQRVAKNRRWSPRAGARPSDD